MRVDLSRRREGGGVVVYGLSDVYYLHDFGLVCFVSGGLWLGAKYVALSVGSWGN